MKVHLLCFVFSVVSFASFCQKIELKKLNINTKADEFAPSYYNDGLAIVSNRKNIVVNSVVEVDKKGKQHFLNDVYFLTSISRNPKKKVFSIAPFLHNDGRKHIGPITFNAAEDYLIVSQTIESTDKKAPDRIGLFHSKFENGVWGQPIPIEFQDSTVNYSHPCLSKDGQRLYYTTDLAGGLGGTDIWYSDKAGNNWSNPIHLDEPINSESNEIFPYFFDDIIYFSSNRKSSLGGYDIYAYDMYKTGRLEHIQEPINSSSNDFGYISKDHGRTGYFSTDRSGNDDVYSFNVSLEFPKTCLPTKKATRCFLFFEDEVRNQEETDVESANYIYKWDFGDGEVGYDEEIRHCYKKAGTYEIILSLVDTVRDTEISSVGIYEIELEEQIPFYIDVFEDKKENVEWAGFYDKSHKKATENTIWKIKDEIFFRYNDLQLKQKYSGNYEVKAFNKNTNDSLCYKSIIWIKGEKSNEIVVVPSDYSKLISKQFKFWIEDQIEINPSINFVLKASKEQLDANKDWLNQMTQSFRENHNKTLRVNTENVEQFLISIE